MADVRHVDDADDADDVRTCVIVGRGRAGGSFDSALRRVGWDVVLVAGHRVVSGATDAAALGADLILLAVPDDVVGTVAVTISASATTVVAHVSGSLGLDVLQPHPRVGSVHPLMSLPDATIGAERLADECVFAVDGDPLMHELVAALGGVAIDVPEDKRALYHGVATIAANHLTALCAQVEQLAAVVGVPASAYWKLMSTTMQNIERVGADAALTGPASRGDWATIRHHLDALPDDDERLLYLALCRRAAQLAGHRLPTEIESAVDRNDSR
jgi:predicted short-subunit dehydrogenase-like oxidoreductase (DUF2520 family)